LKANHILTKNVKISHSYYIFNNSEKNVWCESSWSRGSFSGICFV